MIHDFLLREKESIRITAMEAIINMISVIIMMKLYGIPLKLHKVNDLKDS